jgi:hypothetical protein
VVSSICGPEPAHVLTKPFPFQALFSGAQNKPSGSNEPRPLLHRPDVAPIDTAAHGKYHPDRFGSGVGSPTSPQAHSPWVFAAASSPTTSDPSLETGTSSSLSAHQSQPPAFPIPETGKPPNSVVEKAGLDLRFNITGCVKDIQRVQETTSSNIFKGTYKHTPVNTSLSVDRVC